MHPTGSERFAGGGSGATRTTICGLIVLYVGVNAAYHGSRKDLHDGLVNEVENFVDAVMHPDATAGITAFGGISLSDTPPGVIKAEHRFAQRRLEHMQNWEPTEADIKALRELVNHRAKAGLM